MVKQVMENILEIKFVKNVIKLNVTSQRQLPGTEHSLSPILVDEIKLPFTNISKMPLS